MMANIVVKNGICNKMGNRCLVFPLQDLIIVQKFARFDEILYFCNPMRNLGFHLLAIMTIAIWGVTFVNTKILLRFIVANSSLVPLPNNQKSNSK